MKARSVCLSLRRGAICGAASTPIRDYANATFHPDRRVPDIVQKRFYVNALKIELQSITGSGSARTLAPPETRRQHRHSQYDRHDHRDAARPPRMRPGNARQHGANAAAHIVEAHVDADRG